MIEDIILTFWTESGLARSRIEEEVRALAAGGLLDPSEVESTVARLHAALEEGVAPSRRRVQAAAELLRSAIGPAGKVSGGAADRAEDPSA